MTPPTAPSPFEARAREVTRFGTWLEGRLLHSPIPLSYNELRVLVTHLATHPKIAEDWLSRADRYSREGNLTDTRFQWAAKNGLWLEWGKLSGNPATPESKYHALHAFAFPTAGMESYVLTHPYRLVKDYCVEGRTIVHTGPNGSGKSEMVTDHFGKVDALKEEHLRLLEQGAGLRSQLGMIHRYGTRFLTAADDEEEGEGTDGAATPSADGEAARRRSRELNLYTARGVRFVTNMSISNRSSLAARHQGVSSVSETVLACLRHNRPNAVSDRILTEVGFDEYDSADDRRAAMHTTAFVFSDFRLQLRHFGAVLALVGHDVKRQLGAGTLEASSSLFEKVSDEKKHLATVTVSGIYNHQPFRDVPRSTVEYDPHGSSSLDPDIRLTDIWKVVSAKRTEAVAAGEDWSHETETDTALALIARYHTSKKELAEGKDGQMRSEIRIRLDQGQAPERIARDLAVAYDRPWREFMDTIRDVERRFRAEREARKAGHEPTAEELEAQYDEGGDVADEIGPARAEEERAAR